MKNLRPRYTAASKLSVESLEGRLMLSGDPIISLTAAPTSIDEAENVSFEFGVTDMATGGGGGTIGLDPAAFATNGDLTASSNLFINTSDMALTIATVPNIINPPLFTIPALSLWDGTSIIAAAELFDADGAGPAPEVAVFAFDNFNLPAGFELIAVGSRPTAVLANGDLTIAGTVDASAQRTGADDGTTTSNANLFVPGAGGGDGGVLGDRDGKPALGAPFNAGGVAGSPATFGGFDSAGGGFGGVGGEGGGNFPPAGGVAYGDLLTIGIQGGSGGGAGGVGFGSRMRQGGDGGGGIELGATGSIDITGEILANGGETVNFGGTSRRAGGAAGGGILVHGGDVTLGASALIEANGTDNNTDDVVTAQIGGGGGGGRILIAHAGTFSNQSVDNITATGGLSLNPGADGVVNIIQDASTPVLAAYEYIINWGDGSADTIGTITNAAIGTGSAVTGSFVADHAFDDNDDYNVTVTVNATEADTSVRTGLLVETVTVANVAPTLTLDTLALAGDEGDAFINTGNFADVPADTVTLSASIGTVNDLGAGNWDWSYTGEDDFAGVVTITATDDDGGVADVTFNLDVANVAPVIGTLATDSPTIGGAEQGEVVTLTADFSDAGLLDTQTAVIDWGDGTTSTVDPAGSPISETHIYTDGGIYQVTLTVTDDDTGEATAATQAVIAGVGVNDGELQLIGTDGNDKFKVFKSWYGNSLKVLSRLDGGHYQWQTISQPIDTITMLLGDGHDTGFVSDWVNIDATIDGGAGDDFLAGGRGNDIVLGGAGYDILFGQRGRDLLIGGTGSDLIFGDGGQDILISGTTAYDNYHDSLDLIMAEWTSSRSYAERVDNLQGDLDLSFDGDNDGVFLIADGANATVFDDESTDWLIGGRGKDLYFGGDNDISFNRASELLVETEAEAPSA